MAGTPPPVMHQRSTACGLPRCSSRRRPGRSSPCDRRRAMVRISPLSGPGSPGRAPGTPVRP